MKNILKRSLFLLSTAVLLSSCAKEEFSANKGSQSTSNPALVTNSSTLCSQSTLISPKVDILMLWDNSSSYYVVNSATKASMGNLINSVSENFDYHILSAPLISSNSNTLFEAQLVAKDTTGLSSAAQAIMKSKATAASSLAFTTSTSSAEPGVDRATNIIQSNYSNGIFRKDAYTIIVVISNEDDDSCETETGYNACTGSDASARLAPKIKKLLCIRGNTYENCSGAGNSITLNSTMMRFINISPLNSCATGNYKVNTRYRAVAKAVYEASYSNGWPTSNDHLNPAIPGYPDSYDLCSISFSNIFDGVNSAIKQTLLKHKYDYWPVAGATASIDPSSIIVSRGNVQLVNRAVNNTISNGYELIVDSNGKPATVTYNTRYYPTAGEPFTGKMIRLYGTEGSDKVVYPDCLTVTYTAEKTTYGYIYLKYGQPAIGSSVGDSINVYLNGAKVPYSSSNGWSYMGLQNRGALDSNLAVYDLPAGTSSGYFIQLNGSYKVNNSTSNTFTLYYNSASSN